MTWQIAGGDAGAQQPRKSAQTSRTIGVTPAANGKGQSQAWIWMVSAFCAVCLSAGLVFAILGTKNAGATAAVRVSAFLSFLPFLAAYAGGPLARLFGRLFDSLARHGRDYGLAFAAALSVHLGLAAWLIARSTHPFTPSPLIMAEIFGAIWIYALAVFSLSRLRSVMSPIVWRRFRVLGMNYIALIFVRNFAPFLLKPLYLPFLILAVGAIFLRIAAAIKGRL